ncbi:TPA: hypothetical protein ACUUBR_004161 [Pseudomonas aeruginosa]
MTFITTSLGLWCALHQQTKRGLNAQRSMLMPFLTQEDLGVPTALQRQGSGSDVFCVRCQRMDGSPWTLMEVVG